MPRLPIVQHHQGTDGAEPPQEGHRQSETARAIHSGEAEAEQVHGSATLEQAKSLIEDGIPVSPLPLPVVPPTQVN
jgi:hypothetical protein